LARDKPKMASTSFTSCLTFALSIDKMADKERQTVPGKQIESAVVEACYVHTDPKRPCMTASRRLGHSHPRADLHEKDRCTAHSLIASSNGKGVTACLSRSAAAEFPGVQPAWSGIGISASCKRDPWGKVPKGPEPGTLLLTMDLGNDNDASLCSCTPRWRFAEPQ
jgi:hypothetical protein